MAVAAHHDCPFLDPISAEQLMSHRTIFISCTLHRKGDGKLLTLTSFSEASEFLVSPWDTTSRCGVPFSFTVDVLIPTPGPGSGGPSEAYRRRAVIEAYANLNKTSFPGSFAVNDVAVALRTAPRSPLRMGAAEGSGLNIESTSELLGLLQNSSAWV